MNALQVFKSGMFCDVRATTIDGEPWFVGSDVARALEYEDPSSAVRYYVEEEDIIRGKDISKASRRMLLINESGVYSLIFQSKQARAKEFKRWVTHEVLPALRKTGTYSTESTSVKTLSETGAIELAKIISNTAPVALPYILSVFRNAGYQLDDPVKQIEAKSGSAPDVPKSVRVNRHYQIDIELVQMLNAFYNDHMSISELADRAFVGTSTLYNVMRAKQNTSPEFAERIKASIIEMYKEKEETTN